ncbi:MAG: DUF4870 domain-containing protein [Myxococcaceae bacterium]|nr:DUF4870 domain-containing protein [Myxococcaceae bacterium]MCI0673716.1 DUF4870 domain-containing protein [Myxococcaceae bacterium]
MDPMNQGQSVGSYVAGTGGPLTATVAPTSDEKTMGMLAHLGTIAGIVVGAGFLGWAVPLFLLLTKGKDSAYIRYHAVESLNFQITLMIAAAGSAILICLGIGILMLLAIAGASIVFAIIAGLKANEGEYYRYPFTLRLVK